MIRADAVARPAFCRASGLLSEVPASLVAGPLFEMVTIGSCSVVVTGAGAGARTVPLGPEPTADAVACSELPFRFLSRVR